MRGKGKLIFTKELQSINVLFHNDHMVKWSGEDNQWLLTSLLGRVRRMIHSHVLYVSHHGLLNNYKENISLQWGDLIDTQVNLLYPSSQI